MNLALGSFRNEKKTYMLHIPLFLASQIMQPNFYPTDTSCFAVWTFLKISANSVTLNQRGTLLLERFAHLLPTTLPAYSFRI